MRGICAKRRKEKNVLHKYSYYAIIDAYKSINMQNGGINNE